MRCRMVGSAQGNRRTVISASLTLRPARTAKLDIGCQAGCETEDRHGADGFNYFQLIVVLYRDNSG
jgi:hypothetical protein